MRKLLTAVLSLLLAGHALAQPERPLKPAKKTKEPVTQSLPVLPDAPPAVAAETARLVFHVSPLSAKGLLSQQVRDALKALERENRGAQIVKLRAFVAGTGDMRRVQQIVSEMFSEKKQPLPALTTVQVGALPLEGAQVVMESAGVDKRRVNPGGLVFFPPQPIDVMRGQWRAVAGGGGDILRVTCFLTSLDGLAQARSQVAAVFPALAANAGAANFVQLTRLGGEAAAVCEAVARLPAGAAGIAGLAGGAAVARVPTAPAGAGLGAAAGANGAVVFTGPKIVFSGLQMAFRDEEADLRLALERLKKAVEPLGARLSGGQPVGGGRDGSFVSIYALTRAVGEAARRVVGGGVPVVLEGLPSLDAVVGMDVVAQVE